jgi:hypothetical protein
MEIVAGVGFASRLREEVAVAAALEDFGHAADMDLVQGTQVLLFTEKSLESYVLQIPQNLVVTRSRLGAWVYREEDVEPCKALLMQAMVASSRFDQHVDWTSIAVVASVLPDEYLASLPHAPVKYWTADMTPYRYRRVEDVSKDFTDRPYLFFVECLCSPWNFLAPVGGICDVQLRLVLPPCRGLRIESIALFADTCYEVDVGEGKCLTQAPNALWAPTYSCSEMK